MTTEHFETKLTPEQQEKLKEFNNTLNPFAWLQDGDAVDWNFDPTYMTEVEDEKYGSKRIEFKCYDPVTDHEFKWQAPFGAARQVVSLMQRRVYFLHIERKGADKDTRYTVTEVKA
jgi:hypothetical protein